MKVVYIAPMFHTNQVPIIKGWVEHGHQVAFVSQYEGKTENHQYCVPYILGYSGLFRAVNSLRSFLYRKKAAFCAYPEAFRDKCGFPPLIRLFRYIKKQKPDIVILRERSLYSIAACFVCRLQKRRCILYNQTPLWDSEPPRNDFAHRVVKKLTPSIRMTPVLGNPETGYYDEKAVYIPFVIEPQLAPAQKTYFKNRQINLLCVGKFEERKHHLMLLEILCGLLPEYSLHLTLVGEVSTEYHKNYYNKVQAFIAKHHLENSVSCHTNCKPSDMADFYRSADLFVLPSTGEFASVSQLEAMSYSLPVIVSDTNGTACYIEDGQNGFLFRDKDKADLMKKITNIVADRDRLLRMGSCSYRLVCEKYSFDNYQKQIEQLAMQAAE